MSTTNPEIVLPRLPEEVLQMMRDAHDRGWGLEGAQLSLEGREAQLREKMARIAELEQEATRYKSCTELAMLHPNLDEYLIQTSSRIATLESLVREMRGQMPHLICVTDFETDLGEFVDVRCDWCKRADELLKESK